LTTYPNPIYPISGDRCTLKDTLVHQSHPEIVKRLRRAEGHLRRVIAMVEEGRPCLDLAQQLHAVEKAVNEAKKTLIHDHLDNCLDAAANGRGRPARAIVSEFKAISKYL
jgi:DNA-binding FrmR family transcriptional regulator